MPKITVDFRFLEIEEDLWILSEYVAMLDHGLSTLVEGERRRIWDEAAKEEDEVEASIGNHLEERLDTGVTTRFLTASAITAAWAMYEAAVTSIGRYIRDKRGTALSLNDLRGDFLERARKYYSDVLQFPLHLPGTDWEALRKMAGIRHAFAHANGRVSDMNPDLRTKVENWCKTDPNLRLEDECLIADVAVGKQAVALVQGLLKDLVTRTKASFK